MELKLEKSKSFKERKGPVLLIIMDGIGIGKKDETNAVHLAKTPTLDKLFQSNLKAELKAHGPAVGLPSDSDMGNSEVGHNAIGAGRVFAQGAKLVDLSIQSGEIFKSDIWSDITARGTDGHTIHFLGLLSDGNVHSNIKHLFSIINKCAETGIRRIRLHTLLDGRDVDEKSALEYIKPTRDFLDKINSEKGYDYRIASGGGRMVTTMDRYNADWEVVKRGWDAHVEGIGPKFKSASQAVESFYNQDPKITDQYLSPFVIVDENDKPVGKIMDGDVVINFNFRGDRAIEISRAFEEKDLDTFKRDRIPDVLYVGMMEYDGDLHIPSKFLVHPPLIQRTVSEYLCAANIPSFAISETQKYGHVTYFWNGNRSGYINKELETYIELPSDRIEFDKKPKMKANEITEKAIELLNTNNYKFGRINFANGDMVGHTGIMDAAIIAVETVDSCIAKLLKVIKELQGVAVITADHGNADEMFNYKNGKKNIKTAHTLNPVPFIIYDPFYENEYIVSDIKDPGLANIASTLLNLLGFCKVEDYQDSLIRYNK